MALTDTAIRNAKACEKEYKLSDSGGLYLLVTPDRREALAVEIPGGSPRKEVGHRRVSRNRPGDARKRRDEARELIAAGKDPSREKQQAKHRAKVTGITSAFTRSR